jgi:flagellar biosynthetic protein FlhB
MSEAPDRESKTEEATPRKLDQAREKGDAIKTLDLPSFATLAATGGVILVAGGWLAQQMAFQLLPFLARPQSMTLEGAGGVEVFKHALAASAPTLVLVMAAAMIAGGGASLIQTGWHVVPDKVKPELSKIALDKGFVRLFGPDGLMQFGKSLVKVVIIGVLTWWIIEPYAAKFQNRAALEPAAILPFTMEILKRLVFAVAALSLVIAAGDWLWQRQRFLVRNRMTPQELKEDFKQTDGDPHVKARQRQIRHERARRRMMQAVPTATVVVMNPTHYAVALKYEQGESGAPVCVAKGLDALALKIRSVAEEAGVPVVEDPPLARALYAAVDLDEMIPPAHYEAVAKVIGFILNAAQQRRRPAKPL